ncbi:MAG TPA: YfiR family protein [Bryobacteraceae bacterium]|nr:YfiR family protein [Bryobacteraceae bacterium]
MTTVRLNARITMNGAARRVRARVARATVYGTLVLAAIYGRAGLYADSPRPTEYQVKAAYLANFAKFVEWPPGAVTDSNPIPICVVGQDPFGPVLDATVSGESVDRHPLVARRIGSMSDVDGCRIVFVSSSEAMAGAVLAAAERAPILTVSDVPGFLKQGGMIEFVLDANRVRFEINLAAARAAGLNLSSELLRVATAVRRTP